MPNHISSSIANTPMSGAQILAVIMAIALNALDGFDVLAISFASPGIASQWGVDRAELGIVLSMELIGMCIGSILLGGVADKYGRRPIIQGCLLVMAVGMLLATTASNVASLSFWRILTGLGIGGMLASITAVAAEFSNQQRRHLCVSLVTIGYPIGAVLGGSASSLLLQSYPWQSVFYFGTVVTLLCIPLVYLLIPESVDWLVKKQPARALEKANRVLTRLGKSPLAKLPEVSHSNPAFSVSEIFSPTLIRSTIIVTVAYFLHITTFYFIIKWVPKIVVDMGFAASSAAGVLVWANVGGALGGALFGLVTLRVSLKWLTIGILLLSTFMVSLFGRSPDDLSSLSLYAGLAGFFTNAGVVGLYALFAQAFPTHVRAFGTGFAIGVGRGGAVISPIMAGFLFAAGGELPIVSIIMALGSLIAALVLLGLRKLD